MCSHSRPIIGVPDQEAAIIVVTSLSCLLKHLCRFENSSLLCLASQVEEVRDAMENEMRTQLRRQAAAHTDHLRDVLRVQEQELKFEFEQVRTCFKASSPFQPFPIYVINSLCFHLTCSTSSHMRCGSMGKSFLVVPIVECRGGGSFFVL